MAKGIAFPVRVNVSGGAKLESGTKQLRKLLTLAFSEGTDNNPFQDIGFSLDMIFKIQSHNLTGEIESKVNEIVRSFDGRIELVQERPIEIKREKEGELSLIVRWLDPETQQSIEFRKIFVR